MTVYTPEPLDAVGRESIYIAPTVANVKAPKVAEFTGASAANITCDLTGFNTTTEQGTSDFRKWCETVSTSRLGPAKDSLAPLTFYYNPQQPDDPNYQAYLKLKEGTTWYFADRRGLTRDAALAVGQIADVMRAKIGRMQREEVTMDDQQYFRVTVNVQLMDPIAYDSVFVA